MTSKTPAWTAGEDISIGLGAAVAGQCIKLDPERERIAAKMDAIAEKHGGVTQASVDELTQMLRAEGWHLEPQVDEDGMRSWSIEEGTVYRQEFVTAFVLAARNLLDAGVPAGVVQKTLQNVIDHPGD